MILCSNPFAQYLSQRGEIDVALSRVLSSGRYILGDEVKFFEEEFAQYLGVDYAVGVGSGTEALHIALAACGVGCGDEVITVSNTAVATVAAIELAGGRPVFVDIEPTGYGIDPKLIEKAVTGRTRAIVPVHLYGQPVDMNAVMNVAGRYGLKVIEDCAQAHGAMYGDKKVGSLGDIACFSFYPTKNLGALGDGGLIATGDAGLGEKVRLLREYGWKERNISSLPGWNTRLDELQAAVLRIKLKTLDEQNERRRAVARRYTEAMRGLDLVLPESIDGRRHVYHLYVIRSRKRDDLKSFLNERGVGAMIHYPQPIHLQPAYERLTDGRSPLEITERLAGEILSLPMYPELTEKEIETVTDRVREFFGG